MRNLIIFGLILFLVSCSTNYQDDETPMRLNYLDSNLEQSCNVDSLNSLGLSLEEMKLIGDLHNQYALDIYEAIQLSNYTEYNILEQSLITKYYSELEKFDIGISQNSHEYVVVKSMEMNHQLRDLSYDFEAWNECALTNLGFTIYDKIQFVIDDTYHVRDIDHKIDLLIEEILSTSLNAYEKELLITSAEVARNSFKLWAPIELDGLGLFNKINGGVGSNSRWCWRCAVAGDVGGLALYFNGIAVTGAIHLAWMPVAGGAIATGAAIAAVGGSLMAGSGVTNQNP
jgi:hypothetical protein